MPFGDLVIARTAVITAISASSPTVWRNAWPFLQEDQRRLHATAHLAQRACLGQIVVQALFAELGMGLGHASCKHIVHLGKSRSPVALARPAIARRCAGSAGLAMSATAIVACSAENSVNGVIQRGADVGVIGDRPHQRHAASVRGSTSARISVAAYTSRRVEMPSSRPWPLSARAVAPILTRRTASAMLTPVSVAMMDGLQFAQWGSQNQSRQSVVWCSASGLSSGFGSRGCRKSPVESPGAP